MTELEQQQFEAFCKQMQSQGEWCSVLPILHTLQKHHGETHTHTQTALLYSAASLLLPPAGNNLKSICFWCWIRQHVTFNRLQFLALQRTWKCHTLVVVSWCWGASGYWCFLSPRCACERCPGQTYIVIFLPAFLTQEVSQPTRNGFKADIHERRDVFGPLL